LEQLFEEMKTTISVA